MPIMTPSQAHIDRPLTNLTLAYAQDNSNFIADKVFPLVGEANSRTSTTSSLVRT